MVDLMLMSYEILNFDYSLIASGALFLAARCRNYRINVDYLSIFCESLNTHKLKDFERCVALIKETWISMQTTTHYQILEKISNKYKEQYKILVRDLNPPVYSQKDVSDWFYQD